MVNDQERGRNRGLHYSLYAINAMVQGAEILPHQNNVNLYDYTYTHPIDWYADLELALDYITPFAIDPVSWPFSQTTGITQDDSMTLFELTYSHFQKQSYLDVLNRRGRPMDEIRIMGLNTLIHGNIFELDFEPIPLSGNRLGEYILSPDSYGDFTLTVEARTNEESDNANADYALVFGFEDGENYYYMLFNRTQNNTALFKVIDGTRNELIIAMSDWLSDDKYHTVELRRVSDDIEIRFDGNIVFLYTDNTFPIGQIGLGSFNNSS